MTDRIRTRIAASVTALFIAAVSTAGIATHRPATPSGTATTTVTAQPPQAGAVPVAAPAAHYEENDHE